MPSRRPDGLFDDGAVAVWVIRNFVFTQVRTRHYTLAHAHNFVGPIMDGVRTKLPLGPFVWVSDSRALESYEPGARGVLTDWCIGQRKELERVVLLISPDRRMIRMGTQVAGVAAVLVGVRLHIALHERELEELKVPNPF